MGERARARATRVHSRVLDPHNGVYFEMQLPTKVALTLEDFLHPLGVNRAFSASKKVSGGEQKRLRTARFATSLLPSVAGNNAKK